MINMKTEVFEHIKDHIEREILTENVREWMVIVNKGLLGNKRVVYSTDKKEKAREKFLWYRDMYPDVKFRIMTKTAFRASYHRFPEYLTDKKRDQLFGKNVKEVRYGKHEIEKKYVFSPTKQDVEIERSIPVEKEIIKTYIKEPETSDDEYVPTKPIRIKKVK